MTKNPRPLLTCAAFCLAAAGAAADPRIEEHEVRIKASPGSSATALYATIARVARRECRTITVLPHRRVRLERECRDEFIAEAVRRFGRPNLTAVHAARQDESRDLAATR